MIPTKPRFMHESAYRALMAKHRCYAANALVSGDLSRIDPNIGTALCQVYSLIVVNYCHEVQCALRADGILEHAISQVASFQHTVAQADVAITQVRLPEDVWNNGEPDDGYLRLVERVSAIIGGKSLEFVGTCLSLTAMAALSRDEIDIAFTRRPMQAYYVSTPRAEQSKDIRDCINMEPGMKSLVARFADRYMRDLARRYASEGYRSAFESPSNGGYVNLFDQLAAATTQMTATVPNPGGEDMPVMAIYNSILLILLDQHRRGQPILERIRRVSKLRGEQAGRPGKDAGAHEVHTSMNQFQDAVVVLWQPAGATGLFKQVEITATNCDTPCIVFDAISVFDAEGDGNGLLSSDLSTFLHTVRDIGLEPRVLAWAAGHPKFSAKAAAGSPDYRDAYAALCESGSPERHFTVTPSRIEGLSFNAQRRGDERIPLDLLFEGSCFAALAAGLVKYQIIRGGRSPSDVYVRNPHAIGTTYEHIFPANPAHMQSRCKAIRARHAATNYAAFGDFMVRSGGGVLSFVDRAEAERVNKIRSDRKKVDEHAILHPELRPLRV